MSLPKSFLKLAFSAAVLSSSALIVSSRNASAQAMPACPATNTVTNAQFDTIGGGDGGTCKGTPDVYGLTFFEMGLCQGNPMASGTFDPSICTSTFTSTGGEYHDIAGATVVLGSDSGTARPANGTYDSPYVIISNVFTLKGSYGTTDGGTWFSDGTPQTGNTANLKNTGPAVEFQEPLTNFGGGGGGGCDSQGTDSQSNGTLNAWVTDSALNEATACTGVTRIVGVMTLNSPIVIDDSVTGLQVDFTVENNGMTFIGHPGGGGIATGRPFQAGSGPFAASFTLVR